MKINELRYSSKKNDHQMQSTRSRLTEYKSVAHFETSLKEMYLKTKTPTWDSCTKKVYSMLM